MILADTSVWVDHFRSTDALLQSELVNGTIAMHPLIVAELALGSLKNRARTLAALEALPKVREANLSEVRELIELRRLHGRGIGVVDAYLLGSTLITPGASLWTRDRRLRELAKELLILAPLA